MDNSKDEAVNDDPVERHGPLQTQSYVSVAGIESISGQVFSSDQLKLGDGNFEDAEDGEPDIEFI